MTRDPKWTPRETYAYALAYIGTRGVPALSRLMADEEEWRTEGLWNLQQCAAALGSLGPTAAAARPALMQALTRSYQGFGGEYNEMAKAFQLTPDEAASEIKIVLIQALVNVSDPQREVRDDLMRYMEAEKSPKLRLIAAWGVGLLYAEVRPGLNLAETTLAASDTTDTELQLAALAVLDDFNSIPEAHEKIGLLLPAIRKLADGANDDIKDAASKILDNVAQPSINAAIQWMKKRDFKAAIKEVNTALSINPTSTESIQIRAEAERETGDLDGAVKDYSAALDSSDYVFWAQHALKNAGLLDGELTGEIDEETRKALPKCVRDDKCYAMLKQFN
ncbi:tetratricopeptide repeat protein [Mesorhizobium qingshengii]|uniref:Uncharacterized protein n=1 Tax=Mesorhizobium qingshengii TaxID=1165689 RepID=A0A1G5ZZG0_9HYPH|nr:hypothetical protein [Mesorhizobium qingshengii]SDA99906.1 hypothetical protein SAMN02927914_06779 [Mesorhizobium qingshengii]